MVHQLVAESIVKHFNHQTLLSDIALSCKTGDVIGLLGRNGSGKTTLLNIIYGTLDCENKYLAVDHIKINRLYSVPKTINYLPQHRFIPPYFSVAKAISLFLDEPEQQHILEDEMIQAIKHQKIHELSFGDLRYLEINLILNAPTKFSLLDEPFQGLAPLVIERVEKIILKARSHKGIILVDHHYQSVLDLCNKLYVLQKCCLYPLKDPSELQQYDYLN